MKRILLLLLLVVPFLVNAQIYQQENLFGKTMLRGVFLYDLGIPQDTFPVPVFARGWPHMAAKNDGIYLWSISLQRWITSSGSLLAGKGIDLSSNIASLKANYRSLPTFSEQSFNSLVWSKQTDNTASDHWHDGVQGGSIGDTLLAMGGWYNGGGPVVTDSILYTVDKGATWHFFGHLPFVGHAFVTIDAPDGYHYLKPNDAFSDPSELLKVYRTKDYRTWITLAFPFSLYSAEGFADDDANIYILGGQTSLTDTSTGSGRIYRSIDRGATWSLIASDIVIGGNHFLKGNVRGSIRYRDGKVIVAGGGLYSDDPTQRTYSQKAYAVNIEDIADQTKWWRLPDMTLSSGRQYLSSAVFDGKIFFGFGADAVGNQQDIVYLDKSLQWHSFYDYTAIDRTALLTATHAAPFYVHKDAMYRFLGNGTNETYRLSRSTYIDPISVRDGIGVNDQTFLSQTRDALGAIFSNFAKADPNNSGGVIKTGSDPASWLRINYNEGISGHVNLTGTAGTTALASDNMAFKVDLSKVFHVYNGFVVEAGNLVANGEIYHLGYAGIGSKVMKVVNDGRVLPITGGTDGQVLTLVSGVPVWADATGTVGGTPQTVTFSDVIKTGYNTIGYFPLSDTNSIKFKGLLASGDMSVVVDTTLNTDSSNHYRFRLVNDNATPGNSKYYGTNSSGTKGFFDLPTSGGSPGGSNTQLQFNNSGAFGGSANLTWLSPTLKINGGSGFLNTYSLDIGNNSSLGIGVNGEVNIGNGGYTDPFPGQSYDLKMGGSGKSIATLNQVSFDNQLWQTNGSGASFQSGTSNIGGSGVATATWLKIAAGTTAKSQLNLASSTAPSSPNAGDIWFDGSHLQIRIGSTTYQLDQQGGGSETDPLSIHNGTLVQTSANLNIDGTAEVGTSLTTPIINGSSSSGANLRLNSNTSNNGVILLGANSGYDQSTDRLGINTVGPSYALDVVAPGGIIARFTNSSASSVIGADGSGFYFQPLTSGKGLAFYNAAGTTYFEVLGSGGFGFHGGTARFYNDLQVDGTLTFSSISDYSSGGYDLLVKNQGNDHVEKIPIPIKIVDNQTSDVGNVGTGEDDLMTSADINGLLISDGDEIDIEAEFNQAINANAKTIKFYMGATNIINWNLGTSGGGTVNVRAQIIRTSSTTIEWRWTLIPLNGTLSTNSGTTGSVPTSTTYLKFTGTATADNDIIQQNMTVKYFHKL